MPEGDTVYRAAMRLRAIDADRAGPLTRAELRIPSLIDWDLTGVRVLETVPRGKHLLTRFDNGLTLHSHLKMEGRWDIQSDAGTSPQRQARTRGEREDRVRAILATDSAVAIGSRIVMDLVQTEREGALIGHLGPDLLGPDWDLEIALANLRENPEVPLGEALLDQRNLAGIGNVYKSELCFLHGVDPTTTVDNVRSLERLVRRAYQLLQANKTRTQRATTGINRASKRLWVYGRRGPCVRCGSLIRRAEHGEPGRERVTYWCPSCQPVVGA